MGNVRYSFTAYMLPLSLMIFSLHVATAAHDGSMSLVSILRRKLELCEIANELCCCVEASTRVIQVALDGDVVTVLEYTVDS